MINIGIIGVGVWGKNYLKESRKKKDFKITSFYSNGNSNNILYLKKNYPNIKHVDNLNKFISNSKIDAVIISTPSATCTRRLLQISTYHRR